MRARSAFLAVGGGVVVVGALAIAGWDFLQLSRRLPPPVPAPERATAIVVDKGSRHLTLMRGATPVKTYDVALGASPIGHKQREGDSRTPEGAYAIDFKNLKSRFHLALRISYPNVDDRQHAERSGTSPGRDIMIHGLPNGLGWVGRWHLKRDWTDGCIAVTDAQIEEIWAMVDVGTKIDIRP
jgi:murein L,D-transpeptidase YafK